MAREPRHKRMYKKQPHLERGEDGEVGVAEKEADKVQSGDAGVAMTEHNDGMPAPMRHAHERRDMHNRHETEHSMHEAMNKGSKKDMHTRHEKEMKDMHARHEKEMDSGEGKDQDIKEGKETAKDKGE